MSARYVRAISTACYAFGIVVAAPLLLLLNEEREIRYHAAQGLGFHLVLLLIFVPVSCIGVTIYLHLSKLAGTIVMGIATGYAVVMAVTWCYLIVQTLRGRKVRLWFVGKMAEKALEPSAMKRIEES